MFQTNAVKHKIVVFNFNHRNKTHDSNVPYIQETFNRQYAFFTALFQRLYSCNISTLFIRPVSNAP